MRRTVVGLLGCVLASAALASAPPAAPAPTDCETALLQCGTQCEGSKITDTSLGAPIQSNFATLCKDSCKQGFEACKAQDSKNACPTFFYHCAATCPWKVVESRSDLTVTTSDSFIQCGRACRSAERSCEPVNAKMPPRARTHPFDACQEAQGACYTHCMGYSGMDEDFPDDCAKACFDGVKRCQAKTGAEKCKAFDDECGERCLGVGGDANEADLMRFGNCSDSCKVGADNCASILGVPPPKRPSLH